MAARSAHRSERDGAKSPRRGATRRNQREGDRRLPGRGQHPQGDEGIAGDYRVRDTRRGREGYGFDPYSGDFLPSGSGRHFDETGTRDETASVRRSPTDEGARLPASRRGGGRRRGPRNYQRSDEKIKEDICETLLNSLHIDSSGVTVDVKDGKVAIAGTVPARRMKRDIADIAGAAYGVREIENTIRFTPDTESAVPARDAGVAGPSLARLPRRAAKKG